MSHRTTLKRLLRSAGYELVRSKNHFVYKDSNGSIVIVPNHNKMNNITFKKIKKQIEREVA